MTSDAVKLAKIRDKAERRSEYIGLLNHAVGNPLFLGLVALAANQAAFQAGLYNKLPERSIWGGPVWFTIGAADTPATDRWAKIDGLIVSATVALAFSGGIKSLTAGLGGLKSLVTP